MADKSRLTVYIEDELKTGLEKLAAKERRSLSQQIVFLIDKAVKESEQEQG